MRAFQIADFGSAPQVTEIAVPEPATGEVRVRIAACGLNFADLLMIKGQYQERPEPPVTLGMELAGTVDKVGHAVTDLALGDRVAVYSGHGGLAEAGVFAAQRCSRLHDAMAFETAAALQIAHGSAHLALARRARLQAGETVLVTGAAGGVGLAAVETAKLMGAVVIACARGAARLEVARRAGADHLIDADGDDLRLSVKALGGADVVFDPVGGDVFAAAFRALKPEGRLLTIGFASGEVPQIAANHLLVKNIDVIGLNFGGYLRFNPGALRDSIAQILAWANVGRLTPHISHRFPLGRAAEALEVLRARQAVGKVIITP